MTPGSKWRQWLRPVVRTKGEYRAFVGKITIAAMAMALGLDVANQLMFADNWEAAQRSWLATIIISFSIAFVASSVVGRAYLELYEAKSAVEVLSRTDPLTGLPNRRAFFEAAETRRPEAMALVIIDVDRFKRVNDVRGHLAGDAVLRTVGQLFAVEVGGVGFLGRVGGEEFAVVGDRANAANLVYALDAFRRRMAETPIVFGGQSLTVTVSAGIAMGEPAVTFDGLYAEADAALYRAKAEGRNRICFAPSARHVASHAEADAIAAWQDDLVQDSLPFDEAGVGAGLDKARRA